MLTTATSLCNTVESSGAVFITIKHISEICMYYLRPTEVKMKYLKNVKENQKDSTTNLNCLKQRITSFNMTQNEQRIIVIILHVSYIKRNFMVFAILTCYERMLISLLLFLLFIFTFILN